VAFAKRPTAAVFSYLLMNTDVLTLS